MPLDTARTTRTYKPWSLGSAWDYASQFDTKANWERVIIACEKWIRYSLNTHRDTMPKSTLLLILDFKNHAIARQQIAKK